MLCPNLSAAVADIAQPNRRAASAIGIYRLWRTSARHLRPETRRRCGAGWPHRVWGEETDSRAQPPVKCIRPSWPVTLSNRSQAPARCNDRFDPIQFRLPTDCSGRTPRVRSPRHLTFARLRSFRYSSTSAPLCERSVEPRTAGGLNDSSAARSETSPGGRQAIDEVFSHKLGHQLPFDRDEGRTAVQWLLTVTAAFVAM